jgi:hypothetical protein
LPKAHKGEIKKGFLLESISTLEAFYCLPLFCWASRCTPCVTMDASLDIAQSLESSGDFILILLRLLLLGLQLPFQDVRNEFFNGAVPCFLCMLFAPFEQIGINLNG